MTQLERTALHKVLKHAEHAKMPARMRGSPRGKDFERGWIAAREHVSTLLTRILAATPRELQDFLREPY